MNNQSFTTTILVDQSPAEVFHAINNPRGWWSEEIEGYTTKLNDEFSYHYKDIHRSKLKITEMIPNQKVVWLLLDNYFNFVKDNSEWKNTQVIFEISKKGNQTQLHFTHLGLVPAYECYELCVDGWSNYINESLYKFITTGKGDPITKEGNEFQSVVEEKL